MVAEQGDTFTLTQTFKDTVTMVPQPQALLCVLQPAGKHQQLLTGRPIITENAQIFCRERKACLSGDTADLLKQ